jgi:DNA-binding CsgD family transcriptional regulator
VRRVFARDAGVGTLLQTLNSLPSPARARPRSTSTRCRVIRLDERRALLSPREIEVLEEIGSGANSRTVAATMGISPKTVENHKQRIFTKLGVQNQAHAVSVAMRQGLMTALPAAPRLGLAQ